MRTRDLADSPLASIQAQAPSCDSDLDLLLEPFATYAGPLPSTRDAFRQLAGQLLRSGLAQLSNPMGERHPRPTDVIVPLLKLMSRDSDRHYALRATCYLMLLELDGRTYDEVGREFGIDRQAVHAVYRNLQRRHPEIRCRRDKSPKAREACRTRRTGARKPKTAWTAAAAWSRPSQFLPRPS